MQRYKLILQYDGTNFSGWQLQAAARTIQGVIEEALFPLGPGTRIKVTGAGRTDAGVHAQGQVAHFDLETRLSTIQLKKAINARLPEDVNVIRIAPVDEMFHARFSALKRTYIYQIYSGPSLLFRNQAWSLKLKNIETLNSLAGLITGEHEFLSFSKLNPTLEHFRCRIYYSKWKKTGDMLIFTITGNRFLHHMVRYLVGTMVAVAQGKYDLESFTTLLRNPRPEVHIFKAPPEGLILLKIRYE